MSFLPQKKSNVIVFITSGLALLLILAYVSISFFQKNNDLHKIETLVEVFGTRLQNVPLLGTRDELTQAMQENYGDLVTSPVLLAEWVADALEDPTQVPGRLTSNPFPLRIHITATERLSPYTAKVSGVIEETVGDGVVANTEPITLLIEKSKDRGNQWFIAHVEIPRGGETLEPFGNNEVVQAIERYLLTEDTFSWHTREGSHTVCTFENLDTESELFPLYVWAHCGEYIQEHGMLVPLSGSSQPVKISYPNELSFYTIREFSHEAPRDGAYYTEDVQRIFPEHVQENISTVDRNRLTEINEATALERILAWEQVVEAIEQCDAVSVFQSHSREVSVERKSGTTLHAVEPELDNIFDIVLASESTCGRILMATE